MKIKNNKGISNWGLFIILALLGVILFYLAPKYIKKPKSTAPVQETEQTGPEKDKTGFFDAYHIGKAKAQAAVDASKERYGKN
jgi:hypothetical protein